MKKSFAFLILIISVFTLVSCKDKKYKDTSINVHFYSHSGALSSTTVSSLIDMVEDLKPGDLVPKPEDPTRSGYIFGGWYKDYDQTDGQEWDFNEDRVGNQTIILYAKWTSLLYKLTLYLKGGTLPNNFKGQFDEFGIPYYSFVVEQSLIFDVPSRVGFEFVGWYSYEEYGWGENVATPRKPGETGYVSLPKSFEGDKSLYAHWSAVVAILTFNNNYPIVGEGPAKVATSKISYGDIINLPTLVDDSGRYTFVGWNSKNDGTGVWYNNGEVFERTVTRLALYAIWE